MALPAVTANSPTSGSIAWAAFTIQYQGVGYSIPAGSTSQRWMWWRFASNTIEAGPDIPADLADDDLLILGNKNGVPVRVQSAATVDGELIVDGSIIGDALAANTVMAKNVGADVIVVNEFYALNGLFAKGSGLSGLKYDDDGFLQTDSVGAPRVNFPTDPALPNLVRSELITDGITAQGRVALRGVDNEVSRNSAIVLQTGTTPPANSPSLTLVYQTVDSAFDTTTGYGLTRVGTSWYWMSNLTTLRRRTDAGVYSSQALAFGVNADGGAVSATGQPVLIGNVWYVPGRSSGGPGYTKKHIYMFNATTFAYMGLWQMPGYGNAIGGSGDNDSSVYITAATDGTDLYTAYYDINANKTVVCRITNPSASNRAVAQTWVIPPFSGNTTFARYSFLVGSFDYGSLRFIFSSGFGSTVVYNPATLADTSATESWVTSNANGIGWDGTRFWMQSSGRLYRSGVNKAARTITVGYTWYDSDSAGGGTYETLLSPIVTITQPARQSLNVSTPPPADDGTNNAPDSARLYVGTTTSNLRLQGAAFLNSATFLDVDPATGALPGVNPLFPNGTAALIQSAGGTLVMRGDGTMDVPDPLLPVSAANKRYVDRLNGGAVGIHSHRERRSLQATTNTADIYVDFSTVISESGIAYSAGAWTCPLAGRYQVSAGVHFNTNAAGWRRARIVHRIGSAGAETVRALAQLGAVSGAGVSANPHIVLRADAGDTIRIQAAQGSGGNLDVYGDTSSGATYCSITYLGP